MRFQEKLFYGIIDRRKEYKREMEKTNRKYQAYIQILKEELHPAMGCTEPIALAYAAAVARRELGCLPDRIVIGASGSIIKNVKSVIVPNTNHLKGIPAAVSAGIVAGDPDKELEVIAEATEEDSAKIKDFLENTPITVEHLDQGITFDIVLTLYHGDEYAKVRIANYHTNIVLIEHNGEVVKESEVKGEEEEGLTDRSLLNMKDIWDFINTVDVEEIKEVLDRQMEYNYTIAKEGIRGDYGANIGKVLLDMDDDNVKTRAKAMAAAGSDARMNGCELPVVINSGSGNQGITVSVPVMVYAEELNVEKEKLYRALALSNLTAIHEKTPIGRLSAYCGAVNAGAGAGAGIAYLCGGGYEEVIHTVVNALAIVSGIVCDGAKASCAAKIASAVDAGIPVKINSVLQKGMNEDEFLALARLTLEKKLDVRFIEMMPIGLGKKFETIYNEDILEELKKQYPDIQEDRQIHGNGPAVYVKLPGGQGSVGFISALHGKFCQYCNRIRMTAQGCLKPCLCYGKGVELKDIFDRHEKPQRCGTTMADQETLECLYQAITEAIQLKPKSHRFENLSEITEDKKMSQIGG